MLERTIPPIGGSSPKNIEIRKAEFQKLKNGIPFFVLRAGTQPVVKIEIIFGKGGNYYEHRGGQALFTNKLLNSGTASKTSEQISDLFASFGVQLEIQPSFDNSSISIYCLEKHIEDVLPLFIEILSAPIYSEEEFEREKELQIANLRIQNKKTNILSSKALRSALFTTSHPYGKVLNENEIASLTISDLKDFKSINLSEIEVLISGSFSDHTLEVISTTFEGELNLLGYEKQPITEEIPVVSKDRHRITVDGSVQASIRMGKRMVRKGQKDYVKNLVTNHILGGYFGSRLMRNIREDKGLTYGIYSSIVNLEKASYLVIAADVKSDLSDQAIHEIHNELIELRTNTISHDELTRVKNHMIGTYQSELNSAFALAGKFKSIHQFGLGYEYYEEYLNTIKDITPSDILACANEHFKESEMNEIVVGG